MTEALRDEPFQPEVLQRTLLHEGRIWDLVTETFRYGEAELTREGMEHPGAVAVIALDEQDRVLLIKQYRHPVRQYLWEIPAGMLDVRGESLLAAAQRELAEEADLVAEQWWTLTDFFNSPGGTNEGIRIFLARGLRATEQAFDREDEEADMEQRWASLDEVAEGILQRRLHSPTLQIGVLAALAAKARNWQDLTAADEAWAALRGRAPESGRGRL